MNRYISAALGGLCLVWYASAYPHLFDYFLLDISLTSTLGNCKAQYVMETCRFFARVIIFLWELPLNLVVFGAFAALVVMAEKYIDRVQLSYLGLAIGLAVAYVAVAWQGLSPRLLLGHFIKSVDVSRPTDWLGVGVPLCSENQGRAIRRKSIAEGQVFFFA